MEDHDGYGLWLDCKPLAGHEEIYREYARFSGTLFVAGESPTSRVIAGELSRALRQIFGASAAKEVPRADLGTKSAPAAIVAGRADELASAGIDCSVVEGYRIAVLDEPAPLIVLSGKTDADVLYAAFRFIRFLQTATPLSAISLVDAPKVKWRMLDHWDNPDGSIERGYAGLSLWKWDELPGKVDPRYADYARACASIGLNASCLNNVNASALALSTEYLRKSAAIADSFRPYGVRVFLSANFAAPKTIGGLPSADPCDPAVAAWWAAKADEIYSLIPDFGGFVVKADSEGQPGPFAYGRTHADGANMLAKALDRHGGIVIWRAFVYGHGESDRAKKAYAQFKPHDGEFAANAAIQVKNGPIDFQPREPVSPLFGAMDKTPTFMEFQVTQEYLGQGNHLVYLAPMWKEILDFDTFSKGPNTTVARVLSTECAPGGFSGIAAVSNIGNDRNWCGHHFHAANWFAFGRLAWDPTLDEWEIAREWIACTWGGDPVATETIFSMMRDSWPACVDYMTPLCLHHIMNEGHHYGPNPGDLTPIREDWRPRYYHRASRTGLGFDRTREGSGAVDQYFPPVRDLFADPKRCPEKYLVWFHHVPWEATLQSGRTLMDEIEFRYGRGVRAAESMLARWKSLEGKIDVARFRHVLGKLEIQLADAREWESTCVPYFRSFTKYRNFLGECGYSEETIDAKISAAWDSIFVDPETRFYFESDDGGAYFVDTGNNDARTEGMSYGMMMAVQMNRKDVFDRMWKWSKDHMFMKDGWNAGYFAWSCALDGKHNAEGPAPDGEEYFAMALFLAARRWGEGEGIFAYAAEARSILRACVHKGEPGNPGDPMWDPETKLIKFVPGLPFTDPSYHLPHFYDLFAEWADPADRPFWRSAAEASREFLPRACHPETGLAPEYSAYDGSPNHEQGHGDFFSDSYRVALNIGLDSLWTGGSPATDAIALRICSFFDKISAENFRSYRIDGTPLAEPALHPVGLIATNAVGAIAASRAENGKDIATRAVVRFMETPPRTGVRRYYDNCLYFFALLILSGRYRVW